MLRPSHDVHDNLPVAHAIVPRRQLHFVQLRTGATVVVGQPLRSVLIVPKVIITVGLAQIVQNRGKHGHLAGHAEHPHLKSIGADNVRGSDACSHQLRLVAFTQQNHNDPSVGGGLTNAQHAQDILSVLCVLVLRLELGQNHYGMRRHRSSPLGKRLVVEAITSEYDDSLANVVLTRQGQHLANSCNGLAGLQSDDNVAVFNRGACMLHVKDFPDEIQARLWTGITHQNYMENVISRKIC
mmetsp:Transcript_21480/g.54906  ORF Transcript_21480/g.54906 Transcript_21480/m.54906 type:complete len:240 (-) Transcript_21480:1059-1778(-)